MCISPRLYRSPLLTTAMAIALWGSSALAAKNSLMGKTATAPSEAGSHETAELADGQSRQVLGEAIQRLTVEPRDLPFSLCFHQTSARRAPLPAEPSTGARCVDATGSLNLDVSVAPNAFMTIELPRLADVRIRLFDEAHRLVPSRDWLAIKASQTRYLLMPEAELIPGTKYFLRVDGLVDALPTANDGTTYRNTRISFLTSGEKPPQKSPSKTKQSKFKKNRNSFQNKKQRH